MQLIPSTSATLVASGFGDLVQRSAADCIKEMKLGGIGAMELVAMHMKCCGQYLARSLSFKHATFEIVEVKLSEDFKDMYDR